MPLIKFTTTTSNLIMIIEAFFRIYQGGSGAARLFLSLTSQTHKITENCRNSYV